MGLSYEKKKEELIQKIKDEKVKVLETISQFFTCYFCNKHIKNGGLLLVEEDIIKWLKEIYPIHKKEYDSYFDYSKYIPSLEEIDLNVEPAFD